jgi:thioredoxin 1
MPGRLATSPGMQLPTIDTAGFDALAASPGVTLVDFTAQWCQPCKHLLPVLHELATEYAGRVRFATVDVEAEPVLVQRFDVRSMPTLLVLRDGRPVGRVIGARPRNYVAGVLDRALAGEVAIAAP